MPMFVQSARGSGGQDAVCIPLELTEWGEYDGQTAAVGRRLDNGHEGQTIAVVLTTRDKNAQNRNRKSLEVWQRGFNALGQHFKLEVGGVVSFKNCRRINDSVYVSTWPNVLACNREQVANVFKANHAVARVGMGQDGSGWGDVVVFYPEAAVECRSGSEVREHAARLAEFEQIQEAMFVLRALNARGEVLAATEVMPRRRKQGEHGQETYVLPTPAEVGELAEAYALELGKRSSEIAGFSLMPADRYTLSPRTMSDPGKVQAMLAASQAFREKQSLDQEIYVAKEVLMKMSAPSDVTPGVRFVNGVYPVQPFGRGTNPDLLGGFVYAANAVFEPVRVTTGPDAPAAATSRSSPAVPTTRVAAPARLAAVGTPSENVPLHATPQTSAPAAPTKTLPEDPFAGVPSVQTRRPRM